MVAEPEADRPGAGLLDRLIFLSDGVFAIAMTLLVVDLALPEIVSGEATPLGQRLAALGPRYLSFGISFVVIASYWRAHQRIFRFVVRADEGLVWLNALLLMCIAFQPFPTSVLGTYGDRTESVTFYAGTLAVTGTAILALWIYATAGRRLTRPDIDRRMVEHHAVRAAGIVLVFLISIGIAQVNPGAAELSWLANAVLLFVLRRVYRDAT